MKLQNKCLFTSLTMHLVLGGTVLLTSAFVSSRPKPPGDDIPIITIVPLTDRAVANPGPRPAPAAPSAESVRPTPAPPTETVKPVTPPPPKPPEPVPEPVKPVKPVEEARENPRHHTEAEPPARPDRPALKPAERRRPDPAALARAEAATRRNLTNTVIRRPDPRALRAQQQAEREQEAREIAAYNQAVRSAAEARANRLNGIVGSLGSALANTTSIEAVGGSGGEDAANYGSYVKEIYDRAWVVSPEFSDLEATATVRVTIARDGRVTASRIIDKSPNASMNRSVQKALDDVRKVAPFPPGSRDPERTFKIVFNLQSKRGSG